MATWMTCQPPYGWVAEPRRRLRKQFAFMGLGLAAIMLSGCATVSEKQRLQARLHHECITQQFDRIESAATLGGSTVGLHRACARWAWQQVRALPR